MKISAFLCLLCADAIGRIDMTIISEQSIMELFVQDIENLSSLCDEDGAFIPIEKWPGVALSYDGRVVSVDMAATLSFQDFLYNDGAQYKIGPGGTIHFQFTPRALEVLKIRGLALEGTLKTSDLPSTLRHLDVNHNKLHGSLDATNFPASLQFIDISENAMSETLDLTHLPSKLEIFKANCSKFTGNVDFTSLPQTLSALYLHGNPLSGEIDLSHLPDSLHVINLFGTKFGQEKLVVHLPSEGSAFYSIDIRKFEEIVDTNGREITGGRDWNANAH